MLISHWYPKRLHALTGSSFSFFSFGFFHPITHKPPTSHRGIADISRIPFTGKGKLGLLDLFLLRCGFRILRDQLLTICLAAEAMPLLPLKLLLWKERLACVSTVTKHLQQCSLEGAKATANSSCYFVFLICVSPEICEFCLYCCTLCV